MFDGVLLSQSHSELGASRWVLSPALFPVYINDLIIALHNSGNGCHINGLFLGHMMYADDILLITHSITGVQHMLDISTAESHDPDLKFNTKKSMVVQVRKQQACLCVPLIFDGAALPYVHETKYLGVVQGIISEHPFLKLN